MDTIGEVTIAEVRDKLGLSAKQMVYALGKLEELRLVNKKSALDFKMSAKYISVNADTVARSDIKEMIRNV
jgi:predicted transcriptional regulator